MRYTTPPRTESELVQRINAVSGKPLRYIADQLDLDVPGDLLTNKGWIGQLLENYLVTSAGNNAEPDFQEIGIELKTIPLDRRGKPQESTYVTMANLLPDKTNDWETSLVRSKLKRVLWVPIEGDTSIPVADRRIGSALLWSPSPEQELQLKQDWEEISELIFQGKIDEAVSELGVYLQIRPKGMNARSLQKTSDIDGSIHQTLPRGFYLRSSFTEMILASYITSA